MAGKASVKIVNWYYTENQKQTFFYRYRHSNIQQLNGKKYIYIFHRVTNKIKQWKTKTVQLQKCSSQNTGRNTTLVRRKELFKTVSVLRTCF